MLHFHSRGSRRDSASQARNSMSDGMHVAPEVGEAFEQATDGLADVVTVGIVSYRKYWGRLRYAR